MNTQSGSLPEPSFAANRASPAALSATQPLYWSIRRELWENRSLYIAPVAVACVIVFAFLLSTVTGIWEKTLRLNPALPPDKLVEPFDFAALLIMGTTFLVAIIYCLDALHGERRDRSILFWKSLPVSDLTAVLAKVSIPVVVLPVVTFIVTVATQWVMLMVGSAVVMANGNSPATLWSNLPLFQMWLVLLYHLVAIHGIWYAPIWGWLLLVSSWARRAAFIWAALPLIAVGIIERMAFHTSHFTALLGSRVMGGPEAHSPAPGSAISAMTHLTPGHFLISPGLWIGLLITAACLAGAVRLRRNRGPI